MYSKKYKTEFLPERKYQAVRVKINGYYRIVQRMNGNNQTCKWNYFGRAIPGYIEGDTFHPKYQKDLIFLKKFLPQRVCFPLKKTEFQRRQMGWQYRHNWDEYLKRTNV